MRSTLIIVSINFILILIYYFNHDYINGLRFGVISLPVLVIPFILGGSIYFIKKSYSWKLAFCSALAITLFLALFMLNAYKSSDIYDLYFDQDNIHPKQEIAERKVKAFILSNAAFPNSYHPIKFGNFIKDQIQVYKASKSYDSDSLVDELRQGSMKTLDEMLDTATKQEATETSYSIAHTYELNDIKGVKHRCMSNITFNDSLTVTLLVNNEDWIVKRWNEENYNSTNWEKQFGKQTSR
jgi:hypothetical protein